MSATKPLTRVLTPAGRALELPDGVPFEMQIYFGGRWRAFADDHVEDLVAGRPPALLLHELIGECEDDVVIANLRAYVDACLAAAGRERATPLLPGLN